MKEFRMIYKTGKEKNIKEQIKNRAFVMGLECKVETTTDWFYVETGRVLVSGEDSKMDLFVFFMQGIVASYGGDWRKIQ
jgi:hypothetical protein